MLAPGMLLSHRYRVEQLLGQGGMGSVWSATDERMRRKVALKVLKAAAPGQCDDPEQAGLERRRLLREGRTAYAARHPNVVQVLDVVDETGVPILVMEMLEGKSLRQHLDEVGRMEVGAACDVFAQVASGVGAAHEIGIVHRDLKPENIFLVGPTTGKDAGGPRAKVLDFGIAKIVRRAGDSVTANLTRTGHLVGSPPYMSPEQAFGEEDIDHRTDIWSLGIVLYECLSGVLPTRGDNTGQVFKIITKRGIVPIERIAPEVPAAIACLLGRMLADRPADRPADLQEVMDILGPYTRVRPRAFGPAARNGPPAEPPSLAGVEVQHPTAPPGLPTAPSPPAPGRLRAVLTLGLLMGFSASIGIGIKQWGEGGAERTEGGRPAPGIFIAPSSTPTATPSGGKVPFFPPVQSASLDTDKPVAGPSAPSAAPSRAPSAMNKWLRRSESASRPPPRPLGAPHLNAPPSKKLPDPPQGPKGPSVQPIAPPAGIAIEASAAPLPAATSTARQLQKINPYSRGKVGSK